MTHVVLDASAILALLKGERGAGKVVAVIADASVCAVNQAEVVRLTTGASPAAISTTRAS